MSWFEIAMPFTLGLLYLFIPGLLMATALRVRGFDAFALAPALSIGAIMIGAIVAPALGVTWGPLVPFIAALVLALVLGGLGLVAHRLGIWDAPAPRRAQREPAGSVAGSLAAPRLIQRTPWYSTEQGIYWLSALIGAAFLMRNVTNALGSPEWISQTWDNNFHLNAVRYIENTGSASPLTLGAMTAGEGEPTFYPGAWHALVSLIFMGSGVDIPVATNTVALLVCSVVWPLGMVFMVRQLLNLSAPAVLVTGALAASFTAYPILLLDFGVLYPNLLGIALIPPVLALLAQLFRVVKVRYVATVPAVLLGIPAGLALSLAHPNALMSALVMAVPIFAARLYAQWAAVFSRRASWVSAVLTSVGIAALLAVIYTLWVVIRPPKEAGEMWGPVLSPAQAIGESFVQGPMGQGVQWLLFVLFVMGLYALVRTRHAPVWVFFSWVVVTYFYVAARSLTWEEGRYFVVGIWYHDSYRLAAILPIMAIPLMVLGVDWLVGKIQDARDWSGATSWSPRTVVIALSVAALGLVGVLGQISQPLEDQVRASYFSYQPTNDSPLLTEDERALLENLDEYVPEESEIAVQAFTGAPLAYAIADRKVTAYHTIYSADEETKYLQHNLNNALYDQQVCQIIDENNIDFYLDFGKKEVNSGDHIGWYMGYEDLPQSGVLREVYRSGDAVLYEIVACS
ncbi:MAG: DUF6541 family protein [Rothia sp. (in: high G+C Gram-positive bacteria)]|nr:DUF6541 family protein [Rothia sp. (in: high G+C Gram-positive bacteria)]